MVGLLGALIACGDPPHVPPGLPGLREPPCELVAQHYVVSRLDPPVDAATVDQYEFEAIFHGFLALINRLGHLRRYISPDVPQIDVALAEAVQNGTLLWLMRVETCVDDQDYARVAFAVGRDVDADPSNNFSGMARLGNASAFETPLVGTISDATLTAGDGRLDVPITSFFDVQAGSEPPGWLTSFGVVVTATATGTGLQGKLGVGLPGNTIGETLGPAFVRSANYLIEMDPGCPDACNAWLARLLLDGADVDRDHVLTQVELLEFVWTQDYLYPDLDLTAQYLGDEVFWPNEDETRDHVSFGFGFEAVPYVPAE